jgi:hypothetical protein
VGQGGGLVNGLAERLFAALFADYDLVAFADGLMMAIPRDGSVRVHSGKTLSEVALAIVEAAG